MSEKKEMTPEEAEKDFKDNVFRIFSEKIPGVYVDENGFICIPRRKQRREGSDE